VQNLTGSTVLVAGASSGIGRAVAVAAADAGAHVLAFARRAELLDETAAAVTGSGSVHPCVGDAGSAADLDRAVGLAVTATGRLDVAVNCVGTNAPNRSLTALDDDTWHGLIRGNLDSAYTFTQAVLPVFRRQHDGLIVHVTSRSAQTADASGVAYQAAKAGVTALAHGTRFEEAANGVRVSVVFPGMTNTPLLDRRPRPPTADERRDALQPEDVAHVILAILTLPGRAEVPELSIYPRNS
jgi:NADP-dependent 3-hydroxy acid dehydrogenase YdfG